MTHQPSIDDPGIWLHSLADLMGQLLHSPSKEQLISETLPEFLRLSGAKCGGLVSLDEGEWQPVEWIGPEESLPVESLTDALDRTITIVRDGWCLATMRQDTQSQHSPLHVKPPAAFVLRLDRERTMDDEALTSLTQLLCASAQVLDRSKDRTRRIEQLSIVLKASAEWLQIDDDDALLRHIADTATQLLQCERASIFLWQKRRKKLIGRPALGIEDSPLEVADDAGVVGEVLQSGEPQIWNTDSDDESRVNRQVDKKLEFQTHSLAAVPMHGRRGEIIGVFEAINHHSQKFDGTHAEVLTDLASHAAVAIEAALARRKLTESCDRLVRDAASEAQLIGQHPDINLVRQSADKVAKTDLSVLILGKNGTGKEVLARHLHYQSDRRSGPFIAVNCAALVESLLESELFGHERGAFTDANQTRVGKFELATGGTLFLDEVGDMSPGGQAKLLRVLEEKVVVRVGGSQPIPVDVRVIAATNQPLEQMISEKRFREDLYFRLNVVSLTLPPLSGRGNDVLLLAEHFLNQFCYQIGRPVPSLSDSAKTALISHAWPGNIRELRNTIERVCYLATEPEITAGDLALSTSPGARLADGQETLPLDRRIDLPHELSESTKLFQIEHIKGAIDACHGNMTDAAARLGLHRSNLYRKMRQLGMNASEEGDEEVSA